MVYTKNFINSDNVIVLKYLIDK